MNKPHYLFAQIDLSAIMHNCKLIRGLIPPATRMCVTVKANAYGHGAEVVLPALQAAKVDMLAVAAIVEAQQLRDYGWKGPILLLGSELSLYHNPQKRSLCHWLVGNSVRVSITRREEIEDLATAAQYLNKPAFVHAALDTGMSRMGLAEQDLLELLERTRNTRGVILEGLYTHFATADERDKSFAHQQLQRYKSFIQVLRARKIDVPLLHSANSGATLDLPESHLNMIRPGLAAFGCLPSPEMHNQPDLKPAMRVVSCLTLVKNIPAGSTVGYGCTFTAPEEMLVGIVPIGYADGYSRALSNQGIMRVEGHNVPVIGRISMDLTILDLTALRKAGVAVAPGTEVCVIDNDRRNPNSVENLSALIGTIPYEILTQLGSRIARVGVNHPKPVLKPDAIRTILETGRSQPQPCVHIQS